MTSGKKIGSERLSEFLKETRGLEWLSVIVNVASWC
jgi:hypothetical protein